MAELSRNVDTIIERQRASGKPLAIVLAGHNGSGKSTLWYKPSHSTQLITHESFAFSRPL